MRSKNPKSSIIMIINDLLIGGAERAFVAQANVLVARGKRVVFVVLDKSKIDIDLKNDLSNNVYFREFSFNSVWNFKEWKLLISFIKGIKPNAIYSTLDHANLFSRIFKLFSPSVVVLIRESGMADRKSNKAKMMDMILNIFVNKIIAVSYPVFESLISYQPFYKNKIEVIQNGVIIPHLNDKGIKKQVKLLHVGSMENHNKNQKFLIDVISLFVKEYPNIKIQLSLVGAGKLQQKLVDYTKRCKVEQNVLFLGKCLPGDMDDIYQNSDIFVFASYSEGSPNAVLEAMSYGLPIVAIDISSIRSIINNGENGYLIKIGNVKEFSSQLYKLIIDQSLRDKMGLNARRVVIEKYSLDSVVTKIENLLCN